MRCSSLVIFLLLILCLLILSFWFFSFWFFFLFCVWVVMLTKTKTIPFHTIAILGFSTGYLVFIFILIWNYNWPQLALFYWLWLCMFMINNDQCLMIKWSNDQLKKIGRMLLLAIGLEFVLLQALSRWQKKSCPSIQNIQTQFFYWFNWYFTASIWSTFIGN